MNKHTDKKCRQQVRRAAEVQLTLFPDTANQVPTGETTQVPTEGRLSEPDPCVATSEPENQAPYIDDGFWESILVDEFVPDVEDTEFGEIMEEEFSDAALSSEKPPEVARSSISVPCFENLAELLEPVQTAPSNTGPSRPRHILVRKPKEQEFFRVHPDEKMVLKTKLIYHRVGQIHYQVAFDLWRTFEQDLKEFWLIFCVNRDGQYFLWPARPTESYQRRNCHWGVTDQLAIRKGRTGWIRLATQAGEVGHHIIKAESVNQEPQWPILTLQELSDLAFTDCRIADLNHHVAKELKGWT